MLLVAGDQDEKFVNIAMRMSARLSASSKSSISRQLGSTDARASAANDSREAGASSRSRYEGTNGSQADNTDAAECDHHVGSVRRQQRSRQWRRQQWHDVLVVSNAGHAVHVEAPLQLAAAMTSFLEQVQPDSL
jgi:pimeloyl-ACP methyl ester carboxylesterase